MKDNIHYTMIVEWSDDDDAFIVTIPEFRNAKTHGATYEEATKMGLDLIETLAEFYNETGAPISKPTNYTHRSS
ncbi:MAG: type II toxin-antitoxin system HicB family antitoxin [Ignavibacteria bacterium]|nr:type II toxin-antitoxin system HicB family antitoxin [Ignavibacteria bacterium]